MCTLSWLSSPNGYWLLFTRDERRTRARGRPPAITRRGGIRILAPTDGDFGGTWVGVNSAGVAAALLNRYDDAPADPGVPRVSRGLLVRSLLDSGSTAALLRRLAGLELGTFQPFTLAVVGRGGLIHLADWDGARLVTSGVDRPGLVRTSSGRDQAEAERLRGAAFRQVGGGAARPDIGLLRAFHRSHLPERGAFSVCMHRDEAETHSVIEIRVSRRTATIRYLDGPPCREPARSIRSIPVDR